MVGRICLIAFAFLCSFIAGTNAIKCTNCSYIGNEGGCHGVDCEGIWCVIEATIDTRTSAVLVQVHKSCEDANPFGESGGTKCVNATKAGIQSITCACTTDFCTTGPDSELIYGILLSQNSGAPVIAGVGNETGGPGVGGGNGGSPAPGEATTLASTGGDIFRTATEVLATGSTPEAPGLLGVTPPNSTPSEAGTGTTGGTEAATGGTSPGETGGTTGTVPEGSTGTEGATTPGGGSTEGGTPGPSSTGGLSGGGFLGGGETTLAGTGTGGTTAATIGETSPAVTTPGSEGTTAGGTEASTSPGVTGTGGTGGTTGTAGTAGTEAPTTPGGTEGTNGTIGTTGTEGTGGTVGTAGATTPSVLNVTGASEGTSPAPIEGLGGIGEPPPLMAAGNANVSAGLGDMQNVVNERVKFFSAVSLQRLPPYLAENVVLTGDRQHYDVLTSRLDGDMSFNQVQLDDIVESERIYLPPKPVHEDESNGPEPFNGVLIGRDLEQVNAWPTLQPIQYFFRPSVDNGTRDVIRKAFALWQSHTCVTFVEVPAPADQFVLVIDSQPAPADVISCGASTVGRWPSVMLQIWKTGPESDGCAMVGTIAHEVGHILGLWHAQSRFDAYEFVYVMADTNGNVDVHPQSASQSNYDVGYDYGSIMHFAADAVRPKDPRYTQTTGQRREPSFIDYKTINLQQRCIDSCPPTNCFVGGYATPPECGKCRCPTGFGGDHCETVQASAGECGPRTGSVFSSDNWKEITVNFTGGKGPEHESTCFWHLWGKNGSQVELQVSNVNMSFSPFGCTDSKTGERNFIEIKVGDNDADKSFDFQRTGFRLCNMDPIQGATDRPIVSTNRLIVLAAYAGSAGTFTVRYRNAGGGNPGLASALQASGLANPVRPGIRVSGSANSTAALLFEAGEEAHVGRRGEETNPVDHCDIRRSLVPGDRLASPCRVLRSFYGRYTYVFTRRGRHKVFYNEQYFEPRILIYEARQTPLLQNGILANDKSGLLQIEDGGTKYEPFPYYLSNERQKALGPLKLVVTEDGRLVARSENGTEVTLVCLAHFACVRLHRRLQSIHNTSNDTRVMLQGGILYSESRLYFATLSSRGELAVWERAKATDALSTSSSKMTLVFGPTAKGRTGQPYRLFVERQGYPSIRDGDDEIVWKVNATIAADQLPTSLTLSDKGKLTLTDAHGKEIWTN